MSPRLRLAYLFSRYPAVNHTYLLNEVRSLRRLGLEVRVASVSSPDRPPERMTPEEREERASTFYLKAAAMRAGVVPHLATLLARPGGYLRGLGFAFRMGRGRPRDTAHWLGYFLEAVVLGRWMQTQRLSHVHIHYASNVGLVLPRVFPVTVSQSIHGSAEFVDPAAFHLAEKVREALFVRAISQYGRAQLMRVSPDREWPKIELARLGVDSEFFRPCPFRESPRPFQILCVGTLAPEKGHRVLLEAVAQLVRLGKPVRLHIVGGGPERAGLEQHAADAGIAGQVVFAGVLNRDELREVYRQADLCALASFLEGIPVVLMEAMAQGIACVATRITGIPELIEDGVSGLLVPPADDGALAAALKRLLDDTGLRRRMGEAARRRVLEAYDLNRNTAALAEMFTRRLDRDAASYNTLGSAMPGPQTPSRARGAAR